MLLLIYRFIFHNQRSKILFTAVPEKQNKYLRCMMDDVTVLELLYDVTAVIIYIYVRNTPYIHSSPENNAIWYTVVHSHGRINTRDGTITSVAQWRAHIYIYSEAIHAQEELLQRLSRPTAGTRMTTAGVSVLRRTA